MLVIHIISALILSQTPAAEAEKTLTEAKPVAPEFVSILRNTEKTMDALQNFSVTARVSSSLESAVQKQASTSTQKISVSRPTGKVFISADWAQLGESQERPQLRVLLDGNRLTTYFVPQRLYSLHEGKNAAEELAGEAIIASTLEGSGLHVLTMPEMAGFVISHTEEAKALGTETIDGIACQKFDVNFSGLKISMWFGPGDAPLLRQMSEKTVIAAGEKGQVTSSRVAKLAWDTTSPVADSAFRLELPANGRKVNNILETLSQAGQQSPVGKAAPAIELQGADGTKILPANWQGRRMTLIFWATWMNNPEDALKIAARLNATAKEAVSVLLVNVGESPAKAESVLNSVKGLPKCLFDMDEDLAIALQLQGIPSVVEISEKGEVVAVKAGLPTP
ncbi:MAG: DUF2092 domain-containing protein [Isosphaeraceae bacterium]